MKTNCPIVVSLILLANSTGALAADPSTAKPVHSCCAVEGPPVRTLSDKSVYQLEHSWTNDLGQTLQLSSLAGRPQILAMFFANCQYACPLLVYQMQQIEAALPETLRSNVGLVLVSFDTERDTVAALHSYRLQHALDPGRWTLLRGSSESVLDLAAILGAQYKKDANGQFLHSNLITLLNEKGEIVYQKTGLNLETEQVVQQIRELARR